jgi:signal transduction histidine kinase
MTQGEHAADQSVDGAVSWENGTASGCPPDHNQHMKPADSDYRQLISLIAHELRSPAAVVSGYLRLLLRHNADNPRQGEDNPRLGEPQMPEQRMIEEANRSCARLLQVLRELDDLSALEESDSFRSSGPVPIFQLFDEIVRAAALEGGAAMFSCSDIDRPAFVDGDPDRLKRALGSFVAAIVRERGGPLEAYGFVTRDHRSPPPRAVLALGGPGMASRRDDILASQETSFDRWRGGTGMSLPIACRIVEVHGGSVWALPEEPHATCAVSLPLADAGGAASRITG